MDEREKTLASFRWFDTQRVLFVLVFAIGSLGIITLREFGYPVWVAVAFAVLLMLIYALLGGTKRYFVRVDILGDNTYYLGFLFTLVSLAYTLYRYSSSQSHQVDQIIQNFGLALSTTLFGLLGRVYFSQTREDPAIYQAAVRISLAEQAANLIGETAQIRNDLSTLRVSIGQSVEEGTMGALELFGNAVADETKQFRDHMVRVANTLEVAIKTSLDSFASSVSVVNAKVESSGTSHREIMERNSQSLSQILDLSVTRFAAASDEFGGLLKNASAEFLPTLGSLNSEVRRHTGAVKRLAESLEALEPVDSLLGKYLREPLQSTDAGLREMSNSVNALNAAMTGFATNVSSTGSQLDALATRDLANCAVDVATLNNSLRETIRTLEAIGMGFAEFSSANLKCINELPQDMDSFRQAYRIASEEVSQASRESLASLLALQKSLIGVANTITSAVESNGTR